GGGLRPGGGAKRAFILPIRAVGWLFLSLTPLPPPATLAPGSVHGFTGGSLMGQVHVQVTLTNYREAVLARLGQLDASQVHRYETEALIDTGAVRSVISSALADRLGLMRLRRTEVKYADGRVEEVDMTEIFTVEMLGRETG